MTFIKGYIPWNKGLKGFMNKGSFQKGLTPWNKKPETLIERLCQHCGKRFLWKSRPNRLKLNWGKYCSKSCHLKERNKIMKPSDALKGKPAWNKGKPLGFIPKMAFKPNDPRISKENHWNWQGGLTPLNLALRNSFQYKEWRNAVFKRDNYTCINCGNKESGNLHADHIKPFSLFPKLRFNINNGRTLCQNCHALIGWNYWRDSHTTPLPTY